MTVGKKRVFKVKKREMGKTKRYCKWNFLTEFPKRNNRKKEIVVVILFIFS